MNCCACCNVMSKCYECKVQRLLQSLRWCATTVGGRCVAHNAAGASIRPCGAPSATSVCEVGNYCQFYAGHSSLCSLLLHLSHQRARWVTSANFMQVTPLCSHLTPSATLVCEVGNLSLLSFTPSVALVCKCARCNLSEHVAMGAVVNLHLILQIAVTPVVCIFHHPTSSVIWVSFKQYWWLPYYLDSSTCRECHKHLVLDSSSKMKSD